jgi:hypothetical protein
MGEPMTCEARREVDREPCQHPAKYLVPFDSSVVCGVHRRAFLRCIPLHEIEPTEPADV